MWKNTQNDLCLICCHWSRAIHFIKHSIHIVWLYVWINLDSFPYKTSYTTVKHNFLKGTDMFNQLDPFGSDQRHQTLDLSVIRMLLFVASWHQSWHLSEKNRKSKKFPLEMVSDQTNVHLNPTLIRPFPSRSDFWSYHPQTKVTSDQTIPILKWLLIIPSPDQSDLWSDHSHPEVTSDHTIPRPKWHLIIPSPDRSDLWSYHPQTEVTSDHTIVRWNQIPDPVILVWEHTVCVGLGLIRGHFRMAPQPGLFKIIVLKAVDCTLFKLVFRVKFWTDFRLRMIS